MTSRKQSSSSKHAVPKLFQIEVVDIHQKNRRRTTPAAAATRTRQRYLKTYIARILI
jgi:hypothetical protein